MSNESAAACAARITTDQAFRDEIAAAPDDGARIEIMTAAGFLVTADDREVILNALAASDGEVSDAQLANVSGGCAPSIATPGFVGDASTSR